MNDKYVLNDSLPSKLERESYEDRLDAAREALNHGEIEKAHKLAKAIVDATPNNLQAWLILGCTTSSREKADYCYQRAQALIPRTKEDKQESTRLLTNRSRFIGRSSLHSRVSRRNQTRQKQEATSVSSSLNYKIALNSLRHRSLINVSLLWKVVSSAPPRFLSLLYLFALILADTITIFVEQRIGLLLHGLILIIVLSIGSFVQRIQGRRLMITLALVPLIRIFYLILPLDSLPIMYWYAVEVVMISLAAYIVSRVTGLDRKRIGLIFRDWLPQILVGVSGFGLGLINYYILKSISYVGGLSLQEIRLPFLVLVVFTGFLEEIIFRGLIQQAVVEKLGRFGILYTSGLYAVVNMYQISFLWVVFIFLVSLAFGMIVLKTKSLLGVSIAHSLMNVSLYFVFPTLP
jgi:membrane protease YdiL (CAAX protease family)